MFNPERNIILDAKFWSRFVKNYWQKKAVVYKNAKSEIFDIDAEQVFNWLVTYSDHCRKTKTAAGLKFYIDGISQYQDEVLQVLPVKKDKSLLGYHQRMEKLFSDYCLVCDELIQVSAEKWDLIGDFVNGLYRHVGFPNRQAEIGLYLGNYKKTPFGVHVDGCGVFSIPIVGHKRFRLWTDAYVKRNPDLELAFDYKNHLKASSTMDVTAGDITYWPSQAWHIAESNGSFSATWSLGVWVDQPYSQVVMQTLESIVVPALKNDADKKYIAFKSKPSPGGFVKEIPALLQSSVRQIKNISEAQLQDLFMKQWLVMNSKNGFKSAVKANDKLKLLKNDWICGEAKYPIHWAKLSDRTFCLAAHGTLFFLPESKMHLQLIEALNSGMPFQVKTLLAKTKQAHPVFAVLQRLYQMRKLRKVTGNS